MEEAEQRHRRRPDGRFVPDALLGFAVGWGGKIVRTANGGKSWASGVRRTRDLYAVDFATRCAAGRSAAAGP